MIIVIGRGHSGTRAIARTLVESGFHMGVLNKSYDHTPPELDAFYEAVSLYGRKVSVFSNAWSFEYANAIEPPLTFTEAIFAYTKTAGDGWKLPETLLALPWISKLYPDAHYIHWERDPRTGISGPHLTDDLTRFGVANPRFDITPCRTETEQRVRSWIYQSELVRAAPKPTKWLRIRLEDFVHAQEQTLSKLSSFLGRELVHIPVDVAPTQRTPCTTPRLESYLRQIQSDYATCP